MIKESFWNVECQLWIVKELSYPSHPVTLAMNVVANASKPVVKTLSADERPAIVEKYFKMKIKSENFQ